MTTIDVKNRIAAELWPPRSPLLPYAVLDGARDPRIHALARASTSPQACLYAGQLPPELAEAAPYLVRLEPGAPLTEALLDHGWGNSWGIYLLSTGTIEELRRHLRKFLKVEDENGKTLVFRYYDPRVLRVYLPTCTPGELAALFGPVSFFLVEDDEPTSLLRFHREEGGRLGQVTVRLS